MINDRIYRFIKMLDKNPTSFCEDLGISVTTVFNIIKGRRSKPSYDLILKILKSYDNLNADWLITGKGSMWNDNIVTSQEISPDYINLNARIEELFIKLKTQIIESENVAELEELVNYMMKESSEQKDKLISLYERQQGMVHMLREKIKVDLDK